MNTSEYKNCNDKNGLIMGQFAMLSSNALNKPEEILVLNNSK